MILSLSSLSESDANWWLGLSEILLLVSSAVLVIGLIGEWPDSESWRKRRLYKAAKLAVVLGVVGELIGDGGIFETSARLTVLQQTAIEQADTKAAAAAQRSAILMKENVELERALAPRTVEGSGLVLSIKDLPRLPIFISALEKDEPKETAGYIAGSFTGIVIGGAPTWSVTMWPPERWYPEGITIQYVSAWPDSTDDSSEKVATAICETLKSQEISASTESFGGLKFKRWPTSAPRNAVIIRVGAKPNRFWTNKMLRSRGMEDMPETAFCTSSEFFEWGRQQQIERDKKKPVKQ
jgi:hypothetical protein